MYVSGNKRIDDLNYQGYPLRNYAGVNIYMSVTVDECQYLCEISDLCRYFNHIIEIGDVVNACYLDFGIGAMNRNPIYKDNGAFGHKYSSGKQMTSDPGIKVHFKLTAHLEKSGQPGESVSQQMVPVEMEPERDLNKNCFQPEMEAPALRIQIPSLKNATSPALPL